MMNAVEKTQVNPEILAKWQEKVNLLNETIGASAAMIMKVHPFEIEVCVASENDENPFAPGDKGELNIGTYCDTVVASKKQVEIADASMDEYWKEKLQYNHEMQSYIGLPILYPNEDLFGTICLMNGEAREFTDLDKKLFAHFRKSIESDLIIEEQNDIIRNTSIY
jgi:GAF domain-containing protein